MLLLLVPALAEAKWREASSRHFLIYSEASERDLRQMATQLERFDSLLRAERGLADPDRSPSSRVTIFVVRDIDELQELVGSQGVAGIYFGRASGSIVLTPRIAADGQTRGSVLLSERTTVRSHGNFTPQVVLLHEYMHHFMFNNFNFGAPLWFSEGYPEFYSTARFEADGGITLGTPPWYRGYELTELPPINPKELLLKPDEGHENAAIYGQGWLMSHYLTFEPSRRGQLDAYLRALNAGAQPAEAAAVFGDLDKLGRELRAYLRRPQFGLSTIPAERIKTGPVQIRDLTPAESAVMGVKIQSKRGVDAKMALALVKEARRTAAPYPNDPTAQLVLAEAEYDANNFAAAEAAADRALAADPKLVDAHLYKARAIWGRAEAAKDRSPEVWRDVRSRLAAANRLDPDDAEPLVLFYESFAASGTPPSDNAVTGLLFAQELAPEDRGLRITAVRELLADGESKRALALLAPVVNSVHGGEFRRKLAAVMETVRAGDPKAALAQLDAMRKKAEEDAKKKS
jgi:hypothetical protein